MGNSSMMKVDKRLQIACQAIADKKGFNAITIDVRNISSMTDYFIIAEGNVDRHVTALAKHVEDMLRTVGCRPSHVEGMREGDWVVLDYMDFIIHFFIPELRQHYALEEVWKEGTILEIPVKYGENK
jgi:ribosome-associated protein